MSPMNERISQCIEALGIKKTHFAAKLNVSQAFISQLTKGTAAPSDRTISDICEKFNVNETWLRTGEGDMFIEISRDEAIASFVGDVLKGEDGDFRRRLISVLSRLNTEQWKLLEEIAVSLAEDTKEAGL